MFEVDPEELPDGHVLAEIGSDSYREGFARALADTYTDMRKQEYQRIARHKFMLEHDCKWNADAFIQSACELTAGAYFARLPEATLTPEAIVNDTRKDVDWRVDIAGHVFNIEVKCSVEDSHEGDSGTINLTCIHRLPNKNQTIQDMEDLLAGAGYQIQETKRADNRLKDYLLDTQAKCNPTRPLNELNVLVVCCGDPWSMNTWRGYLYGSGGLFSPTSFCDRSSYANVDIVVLSSSKYLHEYNVARCKESWDLKNTYNLAFLNPRHSRPIQEETYQTFLDWFPNQTRIYHDYKPSHRQAIEVASEVKVAHLPFEKFDRQTQQQMWPGYNFNPNGEQSEPGAEGTSTNAGKVDANHSPLIR